MIPKWAIKKAQELLGSKATVQKGKCGLYAAQGDRAPMCSGVGAHPHPCRGGLPLCSIGRVMLGMFNEIRGQGFTWTEAFARVEIEKHRDGCFHCISSVRCKKLRILTEKPVKLMAGEAARRGVWHSIREYA